MQSPSKSVNDDGVNGRDFGKDQLDEIIAELDAEYTGKLPTRAIRGASVFEPRSLPA